MTDDRLRTLDALDPPNQWADILARAAAPAEADVVDLAGPPATSGPGDRRRLLVAAAVVLVVVVLAGAIALRGRSDRTDRADGGDPSQLWGRKWQLVQVDVGGGSITTELVQPNGDPVTLDARERGTLVLGSPCSLITVGDGGRGGVRVVDGRLDVDWGQVGACPDPLQDLLHFDGVGVHASEDRLVLSRPGVRYEFRPVGSLPPETDIVGRRWMATELTANGETVAMPDGEGTVVDLRTEGEVAVEGCGPATRDGTVEDGRFVMTPGRWQERMLDCAWVPAVEHAAAIQEIIGDGATLQRSGPKLVVRSGRGSFEAVTDTSSSPWGLFDDWLIPSTARWSIVGATDGGVPRPLDGDPHLDVVVDHESQMERAIRVSGCGSFGGEIADLDEEAHTIRYVPFQGGVGMGCDGDEADQQAFITRVLAPNADAHKGVGRPKVDVVGDRARITGEDGDTLVLVRRD
ncbi:MAG TPA: hypothetical protein VNS19_09080 [Acidimicrobiales bacterium]|nr:hypothetical protein [Acidimicrobiales bacterium]